MSEGRLISVACAAAVAMAVAILGAILLSEALGWLTQNDGGGMGELVDMVISLALGLPVIVAVWTSFVWTFGKIEDALDRRAIEEHKRRKVGREI